MSEVEDLERYKLPDWMHAEIFHNQIVPERLAGPAYQERPVVVFIGGQPGAGKTATTDTIKHALDTRGGAAHICGDFYKPYHPDYARLLAEDDRTAGAYTRLDTRQWHTEAEAYVREHHCHAVVETALADPAGFAETARRFHVSGYRVEVAALAVPAALSRLGLMDRYMRQAQIDGRGRFVARANHDACYHGLIETAARIDREGSADTAFAFRRGNDPVFEITAAPMANGQVRHSSLRPSTLSGPVVGVRGSPWRSATISTGLLSNSARNGGPNSLTLPRSRSPLRSLEHRWRPRPLDGPKVPTGSPLK